MNLTKLLTASLAIAATLTSISLPNTQKLEQLTNNYGDVIELADDNVVLLPGAIGSVAKLVVDNEGVNGWQREYIAKPLAEATYQAWRVVNGAIETLSDFAKRIVMPALNLIGTLAGNEPLTNAERAARLKAQVLEGLQGLADGVAGFLPAGFQNLYKLLEGLIDGALETLAGFVGEALYQVWKALHPDAVNATIVAGA